MLVVPGRLELPTSAVSRRRSTTELWDKNFVGAQRGTRTRTPCSATPSRWCVYQFHQLGIVAGFSPAPGSSREKRTGGSHPSCWQSVSRRELDPAPSDPPSPPAGMSDLLYRHGSTDGLWRPMPPKFILEGTSRIPLPSITGKATGLYLGCEPKQLGRPLGVICKKVAPLLLGAGCAPCPEARQDRVNEAVQTLAHLHFLPGRTCRDDRDPPLRKDEDAAGPWRCAPESNRAAADLQSET